MDKVFFVVGIVFLSAVGLTLHGECNECEQSLQVRFFSDAEEIAKYIMSSVASDNDADRGLFGKKNSALLLNGLAQSCAHLGAAVTAQTEQEKKQSILHVMSTVLEVTAQLVDHNEKNNTQPAATQEKTRILEDDLVKNLQTLTNCLIDVSKQETLRNSGSMLSPRLKELADAKSQEEQKSLLKRMLLSATEAQQYVTELLTLIHTFLTTEYEHLSALIKVYILDKIHDWYTETPEPVLRTPQNMLQERADYVVYRTLLLGATHLFSKKEILDAQREVLGDTTRTIPDVVTMVLATDILLLEKILKDEMTKALAL
jgi:hypothetical protein